MIKNIKSLSGILMIISIVASIAALILYILTGVTPFTPKLSTPVIIFLSIGIPFGIASILIPKFSKQIKYLAYIMFLFAFLMFVVAEITYIANIFVAIDGTSFSASFIITFIMLIASFVLALISGNKEEDRLERKEDE